MSSIRVKAIKPLPEALPEGERVLWQGSPAWRPYGRRVFQLNKIALYFLVIVAWAAISAYLNSGEWLAATKALTWAVPPALGVLGLLALTAWAYARTSVYTITNKRVVIQSGVALPTSVNLPFAKVASADLQVFGDDTGDIELSMSGPRLLYSMIWPNVRLLRLKRPVPMLRGLDDPKSVAELLGNALSAQSSSDSPTEPTSTSPASSPTPKETPKEAQSDARGAITT